MYGMTSLVDAVPAEAVGTLLFSMMLAGLLVPPLRVPPAKAFTVTLCVCVLFCRFVKAVPTVPAAVPPLTKPTTA